MKVEGSHRSSLMLLWNSFAADFAFHFFWGSIYQYREERNTGKIGKEVICSSKETGTQRAATSCAPCSQAPRGARPSAHFASRVRYAKRLVAANRYMPKTRTLLCFTLIMESMDFTFMIFMRTICSFKDPVNNEN